MSVNGAIAEKEQHENHPQRLGNIPGTSAGSFSTMHTQRPQRRRRRAKSLVGKAAEKVVKKSKQKTWIVPLTLLLGAVGLYLMNPEHSFVRHGIFLSYRVPGTNDPVMYGKGPKDFVFCLFYALFFAFTREFLMQEILEPIGRHFKVLKPGKLKRFSEQAYTLIYFSIVGCWGLYLMYTTDLWFFNTDAFWTNYPHKTHFASFKAFYLIEAAYWIQQAFVLLLQLEKPRKDYKELVFHHILTLSLISLSYYFHFTWIGVATFITMDVSDVFLALTKVLNYINTPLVYVSFATFIFIWFFMRHYQIFRFMHALLTTMKTIGPFELDWAAGQYKCWISQYITFGLFVCLQLINGFWSIFIIRIALRAIFSHEARDERSDDEDDETSSHESSGESPTRDKKTQ
ncbi:sphingosine N-acyltransferase Lac1 [Schizosaccharomyces japonicus yFS275]|uniref:Sphingosine N-acyltransferase Lac1 n=1 Tax=Schizosaccharomyces japonicus (strain yFS275 / FY16936) TaxID=402676 RepID=B6K1B7_SCHJY|nr:sphingosine N-acyltransferase Lac1 [Schizosaccharomyces japonicus yFS275]EEB07738.2 sphingosine N-acyltransferase Lac1 [Schizosaccharomyces japonicus yFS275]